MQLDDNTFVVNSLMSYKAFIAWAWREWVAIPGQTGEFNNNRKINMATNDQIEQEIQEKGLTAPRITPADIEANIHSEHYTTADSFGGNMDAISAESLNLLTICVLVLKNGFTVSGESACASPANFDAEIGRKIARQNAVNKIWPLMGYVLRNKLVGL